MGDGRSLRGSIRARQEARLTSCENDTFLPESTQLWPFRSHVTTRIPCACSVRTAMPFQMLPCAVAPTRRAEPETIVYPTR